MLIHGIDHNKTLQLEKCLIGRFIASEREATQIAKICELDAKAAEKE